MRQRRDSNGGDQARGQEEHLEEVDLEVETKQVLSLALERNVEANGSRQESVLGRAKRNKAAD